MTNNKIKKWLSKIIKKVIISQFTNRDIVVIAVIF
jgi:hypothetical protein